MESYYMRSNKVNAGGKWLLAYVSLRKGAENHYAAVVNDM